MCPGLGLMTLIMLVYQVEIINKLHGTKVDKRVGHVSQICGARPELDINLNSDNPNH